MFDMEYDKVCSHTNALKIGRSKHSMKIDRDRLIRFKEKSCFDDNGNDDESRKDYVQVDASFSTRKFKILTF